MERNRIRATYWPNYPQFGAFKIIHQSFPPAPISSHWQWRFQNPALRGAIINWGYQSRSRGFNTQFRPPVRTAVPCPQFQGSGRKVRRVLTNQSHKTRPNILRYSNFHPRKRRRSLRNLNLTLNPSDPLNLQGLMNETDRRRTEGLSPLRGDSRFNTPALSVSGELSNASPAVGAALTASLTQMALQESKNKGNSSQKRNEMSHRFRNFARYSRRGRWQGKRLPLTGNYPDYYSRRDPEDRVKFLMPEWFSSRDVADYGCHNGTLTFRIIEKFPDVRKIDAFDCDSELIEIAKNMQRERIRWVPQNSVKYDKINFQVADWGECSSFDDEPMYDTILAFSVTKWVHLNYGDAGLLRFFRRVFNLLKPGGHLLLEPQPKSSYKKTRFNALQQENFKNLTIDPSNLEPLLLDVGFSYFDKIKIPRPHEAFQRSIILCSKSYGVTPSSIRNDCRDEAQLWRDSPSGSPLPAGPPPVSYRPLTPSYSSIVSPRSSLAQLRTPNLTTPTQEIHQSEVVSSSVSNDTLTGSPSAALNDTDHLVISSLGSGDVTISVPDSTSEH